MRAIAVSRDLLALGLGRGSRVEIDGLPGEYVVLDKTHRRWIRRVDLFMGEDVRKALRWGKRKMRIRCIESCDVKMG
jgi:3D (Asp-Asp-Asp) domain-containing protein